MWWSLAMIVLFLSGGDSLSGGQGSATPGQIGNTLADRALNNYLLSYLSAYGVNR